MVDWLRRGRTLHSRKLQAKRRKEAEQAAHDDEEQAAAAAEEARLQALKQELINRRIQQVRQQENSLQPTPT